MQDASDADFPFPNDAPAESSDLTNDQPPVVDEPPAREEPKILEEPEAKQKTPQERLKPGEKKLDSKESISKAKSKYEVARTEAQQLSDSRHQVQRQKEELANLKQEVAAIRKEREDQAAAAKIAQDPVENLLSKGYKPEDAEKEALRREEAGDIDGAVTARNMAADMRSKLNERAEAARAQENAWQTPGTDQFNQSWMANEAELQRIENQHGDEWDRELIKQFPDKNSEIGKRLVAYLTNDPVGQLCLKQNQGIFYAYNTVKNQYKIEILRTENQKLQKELGRTSRLTSLGGSAPATSGGHTNGNKRFEDMTTAEMKAHLRSRIEE